MDLRQLRYFTVIAAEGSLSRASTILNVGQSALTRQLQLLEEEAGLPLLHRTGHGVTLTSAGSSFLVSAEGVLNSAQRALHEVQALRGTPSGKVVLGIPPMLGEHLLVPLVRRYREECPEVKLRIREGISGYVMEWLMTGQVDVAVVYNPPPRATLHVEPLISDDLFLVGAASTGAAAMGPPITFAEAIRTPLILPSDHHGLRYIVDQAARDARVVPAVALEVDGFASMLALVTGGLGTTVLPYAFARSGMERGLLSLRPIVDPKLTGIFSAGMTTQRPVTAAMRSLFNALRKETRKLALDGVWRSFDAEGRAAEVS